VRSPPWYRWFARSASIRSSRCGTTERMSAAPRELLSDCITQHARLRGNAPALIAGALRLSHRELDAAVAARARELAAAGVAAGAHIGVHADRSAAAIVAMLAILRLGAVYVPLNARMPAQRLLGFVERSDVRLVVSIAEPALAAPVPVLRWHSLPDIDPDAPVGAWNADADAAYNIQTSGTTGTSKPVLVGRDSLDAHLRATIERFGIVTDDRVLHVCAPSFDVSIEEVLPTLCAGACVVIAPDPQTEGIAAIDDCFRREALTLLNLPTALWSAWLDHLAAAGLPLPPSLRAVIVGGEACPPAQARRWQQRYAGAVHCLNGYGLTETTITNSCWPLPTADVAAIDQVPVGEALAGNALHILDEHLEPVDGQDCGELYIGGPQVARGYHRAPAETAARFLPDPFADRPGARMFRTGDRAYRDREGAVVVVGRVDRQVKLHGYRIELGEIEHRLMRQPGIRGAYVERARAGSADVLIAYLVDDTAIERGRFVGRQNDAVTRALVDALSAELPGYMLPAYYCRLDAFPLTANAKIDAHALPPLDFDADTAAADGDESDARIAALIAAFGFRPSLDAGFYDVGGDSVLALKLMSTLRSAGFLLELRDLLGAPTLSTALARCRASAAMPAEPVGRMAFVTAAKLGRAELQQFHAHPSWRDIEFICGPTPLQLEMLAQSLRHPRSGFCIEQVEGVLHDLDVAAFKRAWARVAERHEALRSYFSFRIEGRPLLICNRHAAQTWRESSWVDRPAHERGRLLQHYLQADRREEFALLPLPPYRWHLIRLDDRTHQFVWTYHHALLDGWSDVMLLGEAFALYDAEREGREHPLPPAQSYRRYAAWLQSQPRAPGFDYWREQLASLGAERRWLLAVAGARAGGIRGVECVVGAIESRRVGEAARRFGVPASTLYVTAFGQALAAARGCERVAFGQFVWVRPPALPELAHTAGLFINLVPLVVSAAGDEHARAALHAVLAAQIAREPYLHLGSEEIIGCAPAAAGKALFDCAVIVENYAESAHPIVAGLRTHAQSTIPLNFFFWPGERLRLEIKFDAGLIDGELVARLLDDVHRRLLAFAGADEVAPAAIDAALQSTRSAVAAPM
jgi:amino acid adenylation domain-containing protein